MFTRHYDVIVAGLGPGALLAGALLAKRGLRVLALDQSPPEAVRQGPWAFPSHDHLLSGFDDPLLLASALDELTVHPGRRRAIRRSGIQVLLPRLRAEIAPEPQELEREVVRELGEESEAVLHLMDALREEAGRLALAWQQRRSTLPSPSLFQRVGRRFGRERALFDGGLGTLGQLLDQSGLSPHARVFITAPLTAFGHVVDPENLPVPVAAHLLLSARAGAYRAQGTREPLKDLLLHRLMELHGERSESDHIAEIHFSWGKATEVVLAGHDRAYECDHVLWGASYDALVETLPESLQGRYTSPMADLQPEYGRFCVHLAVHGRGIPEGMADHLVSVLDPEAPLLDGNLMQVSVSPSGDERWAPAAQRAMTLSTPVRLTDDADTPAAQAELAQRLLAHLRTFAPFVDDHLVGVWTAPADRALPSTRALWTARQVGAACPRDLGPGPRLPHWNLFHCGREAYPLLGFEGEIAAGILAVDAVTVSRK